MTVKLNDGGYSKQFIHDELYLNNSFKFYSCLEKENNLTQKEKIILMQYSEEIVKEAMDVVLHMLPNKPLSEQIRIYCNAKVTPKTSFWEKHKTKILIGTAIVISSLAIGLLWSMNQPIKGCVEGFYDRWNNTKCINGEFTFLENKGFPDRSRFRRLIEECASGAQIPGCFHGNYYRELTPECRYNPAASLCDGKYDYQNFLKEVEGFRPTGIN